MGKVSIDVQATPNPNALKFVIDRPTTDGAPRSFRSVEEAAGNPMGTGLLEVAGVESVFMTANFISVMKTEGAQWEQIVPEVTRAIEDGFAT
jgi:hypothetical protein